MTDADWVTLDDQHVDEVLLAAKNGNHPDVDEPLDSWRPQDLNDLPETPPVPPNLGGTHLVYPGKRHVFSGPPESAKTLAAYCILIQTVRNGQSAILIDFEMGAYDARQRLRELGARPEEISGIAYVEPDERANVDRIGNLMYLDPTLVVIDAAAGIYSLEGLDDNKRGDVEKISNLYIRAFWRAGIATILLDHVIKDSESRGKYAIGSERKLGGADVHLGFEVIANQAISRGGKGRYKITTHKDRGGYLKRGHLADLELDSDPATHNITWDFNEPETAVDEAGHFRPTHLMEKVSIDLEARVEAASRNTVCTTLGGTRDYVVKAIDALVREGFASETTGPRNAKLLTSERPYREDEPVDNPQVDPTSSPVRHLFGSCSANGSTSTCSDSPCKGESTRTGRDATTEQDLFGKSGWFNEDGKLDDTGQAAWFESITPEDDDDLTP